MQGARKTNNINNITKRSFQFIYQKKDSIFPVDNHRRCNIRNIQENKTL